MYKKRIFFLLVFLGLFLVSCGPASCSSSSDQPPQIFLTTTTLDVSSISWTEQPDGSLSGSWIGIKYETPLSQAHYHDFSSSVTGQHKGEQVTLNVAGFSMTGTLKENLLINGTDNEGKPSIQTWVKGTDADYTQLLEVFHAYQKLQGRLQYVEETMKLVPPDSDPGSYDFPVLEAQQEVGTVVSKWSLVEQASSKCVALKGFLNYYPLHTNFQAKKAIDSIIGSGLQKVDQALQDAEGKPLPNLQNLVLPWKIGSNDVTSQTLSARTLYTKLQEAESAAQKELDQQKKLYDDLSVKVAQQQKLCS